MSMIAVFSAINQPDQQAPSRNNDRMLFASVLFCLLTVAGAIVFPWKRDSSCDRHFPTYMVIQAGLLLLSVSFGLREAFSLRLKEYPLWIIIYLVVCCFLAFFGLMVWSLWQSSPDCGPELWTLGCIVFFTPILSGFCYGCFYFQKCRAP